MWPHIVCFEFDAFLGATFLLTDVIVGLCYYLIPLGAIMATRRSVTPSTATFPLLLMFVFSCGTDHLFSAWNLYHVNYNAQAVGKIVMTGTSIASVADLFAMIYRARTR